MIATYIYNMQVLADALVVVVQSYLDQIRIWPWLLSGSAGHPGKQRWPSFNAGMRDKAEKLKLIQG